MEYQTPAHRLCPKGTQPNQDPAQNESRLNKKTKRHAGYALNEIEKRPKKMPPSILHFVILRFVLQTI
jgi:hypothetical protein